jgi:hypothetical protein
MHGVAFCLVTIAILTSGYGLVWLCCPGLYAWMESPRDRFVEQQRRFPRVVRHDPASVRAGGDSNRPNGRPPCSEN